MKSPFPGMDPYIEERGRWADFHTKLIGEIERTLAVALPDRYFIQIGERSYVVLAGTDGKEESQFCPDVGVELSEREVSLPARGVAVAVPSTASDAVTIRAFIEERFRENFIEIYTADPELRLVTCIELLSPSNKRRGSEGWEQYLRKRNALLLGTANLVEIDLLRSGQRLPMVEPWPDSAYYFLVGRQSHVPYCRVWPVHCHRVLPEIPVPLANPDPDVPLALGPLIDAVYERSRYAQRIDYSKPLHPPLPPEQATCLQPPVSGENQTGKSRTTRQRRGRGM
jgi:Protein of unknown function (DUF4058)